jgi:hypothetical protein
VRELAPAAPQRRRPRWPPGRPRAWRACRRRRPSGVGAAPGAPGVNAEPVLPARPIEPAPPIDLATLEPLPQALVPMIESAATEPAHLDQPSPEWPPSTQLSYTLTGHYRGPVQGQARVEWLRSGTRYQVHMDLSVGPAFAPLMSRRVSSEGDITALGLQPRRYDEVTHVALRPSRPLTIFLDADQVRLANRCRGAAAGRCAGQCQPVRAADLAVHDAAGTCCRPVAGWMCRWPCHARWRPGPTRCWRPSSWTRLQARWPRCMSSPDARPGRPRSGGRVLGRAQPAVPAGAHPHPPGRRNLCRPGHRPVAQTGRGGALTQLSGP